MSTNNTSKRGIHKLRGRISVTNSSQPAFFIPDYLPNDFFVCDKALKAHPHIQKQMSLLSSFSLCNIKDFTDLKED